ncbi:hypothetical protein K443DRAFT_677457 [Laccaria amethystina LaAM-08-1]|uniref:Uncharacterized protein n=1 Tax=Laccaria amethystina LaAM-08-1 TaxID=1095629 RepID=A0A0C9WU06_9AGAR|nr:hypothetical protein K443DRAFT_677457 [Laccaria amethystina LaAM-08-1]
MTSFLQLRSLKLHLRAKAFTRDSLFHWPPPARLSHCSSLVHLPGKRPRRALSYIAAQAPHVSSQWNLDTLSNLSSIFHWMKHPKNATSPCSLPP